MAERVARPFIRTTIRVAPELLKAAQRLARKRSETFSGLLRRYLIAGLERDGVKFEMAAVLEARPAPEAPEQSGGALDL